MGLIKDFWPQYRRLLQFVQPYRGRLIAGIVFSILYGPTNVAVLAVVRKAWASFFDHRPENFELEQALGMALLLPVTMSVRGFCDFMGGYLMNWVGFRAVMDIRVRMFDHLQRLSLDYYTGTRTGELMSRVTNDTGVVQQGIANVIEDVIKEPITLISVLVWLLYSYPKMTLVSLVVFPACIIPIIILGKRTRRASKASQQDQADLLAVLQEAIAGLRVIRAFSAEARETEDFRVICKNFFRQRMRVVRARAISTPIVELVAGVAGAAVFMYAYHARLSSSDLVAFGLGLFMLYGPVKKLTRVHLQIQETMAAGERIFQLIDQQPSVVELPAAPALPRFSKSIEFDRVSFRYEQNGSGPVLDNVTVSIPAGALVAIVGASGAGKTTLFNMIPRFYDPVGGAVRIDGVDLRQVSFESLRGQIGLVTQETFLFNDTVAGNIAYGKPNATREEIIEAAKRAHAHDFISQMPQGYDTSTGDLGVKLSGGQRQRLAIARAILKNPPILLLDEATSALDTESERVVQAALDDLMWGTGIQSRPTMVVIAHRLSTVQHANQIIVLDKGRVVEQGTHAELIAKGGTYKRLHDLQFRA